jgi:hypothetical protein
MQSFLGDAQLTGRGAGRGQSNDLPRPAGLKFSIEIATLLTASSFVDGGSAEIVAAGPMSGRSLPQLAGLAGFRGELHAAQCIGN